MVRNPSSVKRLALGLCVCWGAAGVQPTVGWTQEQPSPIAKPPAPGTDYDATVNPKVVSPTPTKQPRAEQLRPLTRTERERLQQANQAALTLVRESEQAFDLGLMPLQDHLLHLQTADDVVLSAAAMQNDPAARQQVLQHRVERLRTVQAGYESLNNYWPVAPGDQALVETLLSQTVAEMATLEDEHQVDRRAAASARVIDWTDRLVDATKLEVITGSGTPEKVLQAQRIRSGLQIPTEDVAAIRTAIQDQRNDQAAFVRQLEQWSQVGSPLGRADRLAAARFELARLNYDLANVDDNSTARTTAFREGIQASSELHAALTEFYQIGTASLFDLATAWQQRRGMVTQYVDDTETTVDAVQQGLLQDFQEIRRIAASTQDRRGRIAADTQFVEVLGGREVIDQIATARGNIRR